MNSKDLLSIGEMSKLCRIPVKTLRYFDKTGTVKPAYIDPITQYRYYSKVQLPYILVVRELRLSGISLAEIRKTSEIIESNDVDQYAALFDKRLARIEEQIRKLQKLQQQFASWKKSFEYRRNIQFENISVKNISPRTVVFTRFRSKYELFALNVRFAEISHLIHDNNLNHKGPQMAVLHDSDQILNPLDTEIEVGIEILPPKSFNYPFIKEIPGGLYASVIHQGSLETVMNKIVPALHSWIKEHHYQVTGLAIQVYLWVDGMGQFPEKLVTEVQIPVKINE